MNFRSLGTICLLAGSLAVSADLAFAESTPPVTTKQESGLLIDGIAATVGDEVILFSDLQRAVKHSSNNQVTLEPGAKIRGEGATEKDIASLLDQLIDQRVLSVRIRDLGLSLTEEELNSEIQNFLKNQKITPERFQEILAQEGETNEGYREEFKRQTETQRFIGRSIRPLVSVTDDEIRNYYLQQNAGKNKQGIKKIKLRSLLVSTPSDANPETKNKKQDLIKKIVGEIAIGKKFEDLVKLYSEEPLASKTAGILAPKLASELPAEVRTAVADVKTGKVVGPFVFGGSTFFFEYLGIDVSENGDFLAQKAGLESKLLETKFQERLTEFVKSERSKLKIDKFDIKVTK